MTNTLDQLETEQVNQNTMDIDKMSTIDMLTTINREDQTVALAVEKKLPQISNIVDCIYKQMQSGGRLIYIGAGTSGRLGVLDASECPPTFGVDEELVQGIIAGGNIALTKALESVEDCNDAAKIALENIQLRGEDVVIGLASSGKTPYVIGGIEYAKSRGCKTASICCVSNARISSLVDFPLEIITGPEVVTGSTRLKAGTGQKMVLNMISTSVMIKLGKVYGNLMVDVQPTNEKLKQRAVGIVSKAIQCDRKKAALLLEGTSYSVKEAIIMGITGLNKQEAQRILKENHQHISNAIREVKG